MREAEGVIKFNLQWVEKELLIPEPQFSTLNDCRLRMNRLGFIGEYPDGTGYGNISIKINFRNQFYISGSGTGGNEKSYRHHFALVESYSIDGNSIVCSGLVKASSESLTHAAIFEADDRINSVIHIHNKLLWTKYRGDLPTTSEDIHYGTPEMAYAVKKIFRNPATRNGGIIIMGGHEDGIISFGSTVEIAEKKIMAIL